jgi:tetratricopeptide (TPR) repeat protein
MSWSTVSFLLTLSKYDVWKIVKVKDNAGRPKDQGKAEECFREALTLDNNHLLSLLALGSLMWHQKYLTKAEVLLRSAIELHPEQEFIPWCILSRVCYAPPELTALFPIPIWQCDWNKM